MYLIIIGKRNLLEGSFWAIGIPRILQWSGFTGWIQNFSNGDWARVCGQQKSPTGSRPWPR